MSHKSFWEVKGPQYFADLKKRKVIEKIKMYPTQTFKNLNMKNLANLI